MASSLKNKPLSLTTPLVKKVVPKCPQAFRNYKYKIIISSKHAQSEAEGI